MSKSKRRTGKSVRSGDPRCTCWLCTPAREKKRIVKARDMKKEILDVDR